MDLLDLRRGAHQLHAVAEQVRRLAAEVSSAAGVEWQSSAAERFRDRLAVEASAVRRCAHALDDAAHAFAAHAAAVRDHAPLAAVREFLVRQGEP
jgi:uncharacterized protein YukE